MANTHKTYTLRHRPSEPQHIALCTLERVLAAGKDQHAREWYIDSGATRHFTNDKEALQNFTTIKDEVHVGDGRSIPILGKGQVKFIAGTTGNDVILENVFYAPEMSASLISLGRLARIGVQSNQNGTTWIFKTSTGLEIFRANQESNGFLWKLNGRIQKVNKVLLVNDEVLWHKRMGHAGHRAIQRLVKEDLVIGKVIASAEKVDCEICSLSKAKRRPFPTSTNPPAKHPMDLVHFDFCEIGEPGLQGERYCLTLIDDHSDAKFALTMKTRGEVSLHFKKWMNWAERMADRKLKCVRCDNAKEFKEGRMKELLDEFGVEYELTEPYEHEQNGKVERANRTLLEKARCMLAESKLSLKYWPFAFRAAEFVANRTPVKGRNRTPLEMFSEIKPRVDMIRVFGSQELRNAS